jgi:DNA-binding winged helix-turn-helix (wHTH) protein
VRYRWDDFLLDLDAYRLERAGTPLALEPKALNLLAVLVQRPGHLFTKQEIFEAVWPQTAVTDHALTRIVAQLRRALGDEAREARFLQTVPTRGYRWIRPVALDAPVTPVVAAGADASTAHQQGRAPTGARASGAVPRFVLVVALALAIAGLVWTTYSRALPSASVRAEAVGAAAPRPSWPVQLTTHGGLDMNPAFSRTAMPWRSPPIAPVTSSCTSVRSWADPPSGRSRATAGTTCNRRGRRTGARWPSTRNAAAASG